MVEMQQEHDVTVPEVLQRGEMFNFLSILRPSPVVWVLEDCPGHVSLPEPSNRQLYCICKQETHEKAQQNLIRSD